MAYPSFITTSLFGRRLGLQTHSTAQTGGRLPFDSLAGAEAVRTGVTTAESTATNLVAYGLSVLPGTSAASSAVYTLDPPVPGMRKLIYGATDNGPVYAKTANSETIVTTAGSSWTTIKISSLGGAIELMGLTTAKWLALGLTSGTSSNASGFGLTTST